MLLNGKANTRRVAIEYIDWLEAKRMELEKESQDSKRGIMKSEPRLIVKSILTKDRKTPAKKAKKSKATGKTLTVPGKVGYKYPKKGIEHQTEAKAADAPIPVVYSRANPENFAATMRVELPVLQRMALQHRDSKGGGGERGFTDTMKRRAGRFLKKRKIDSSYLHDLYYALVKDMPRSGK